MMSFRKIDLRNMFEDAPDASGENDVPKVASVTVFDPSGKFLAVAIGARVAVYAIETGARLEEYTLVGERRESISDAAQADVRATTMAMTADGTLVVESEICRRDSGVVQVVLEVFDRRSGALRFSLGARDWTLDPMGDAREDKLARWTRKGCSAWALSADGATLAVGDFDGGLAFVDALSGESMRRLTTSWVSDSYELVHPMYRRPVRALAFDRSGMKLGVARWVSVGYSGEYEVGLVDLQRHDRFPGIVRHHRQLPIEDDIRVFGPRVKMACVGDGVLIAHDEESANTVELLYPNRQYSRRWTRLGKYGVIAINHDAERILCMLRISPAHPGHMWFKLGRKVDDESERYETFDLEEMDVRSLQRLEGMSGKVFYGGTLSHDGAWMALISDACVVVGPCV